MINVHSQYSQSLPSHHQTMPLIHNDATSLNGYSSLLFDIKSTETAYKTHLSQLLGCCTPLKTSPLTSANSSSSTKIIRRLIAHHTELSRLLNASDEVECVGSFVNWCGSSIPIYENYIKQFNLDSNMIEMEIKLKKIPLKRVNQLNKFLTRFADLNNSMNISMALDSRIIYSFNKLVEFAKDQNEKQNMNLDLNSFYFDKVYELDEKYTHTSSYFDIDNIVMRDYFKFSFTHPLAKKSDLLVEVFELADNSFAICSVESVGRSLMFPPFKVSEFEILKNDLESIVLSKYVTNGDALLVLTCPDQSQTLEWNDFFSTNKTGLSSFDEQHKKLNQLKREKIGLGLHINSEIMGITSPKDAPKLRKSSTLMTKHSSLQSSDDSTLDAIATKLQKEVVSPMATKMREFNTKSPSSSSQKPSFYVQNSSTVSLPISRLIDEPAHNFSTNHPSHSTTDLSNLKGSKPSFKIKKRKSIFNLFTKRDHKDEPKFEIVTKQNSSKASSPDSTAPSSDYRQEKPLSMAALNKNVKNLAINTALAPKKQELPSPFSISKLKAATITTLEEKHLSTAEVFQCLTKTCIVSKWSNNTWESIGKEYQNELKFLTNDEYTLMALYSSSDTIPDMLIPINDPKTTIRKSSALDLQIRCLKSIQSSQLIMLTIRCPDSKINRLISDIFEKALSPPLEKDILSASNSFGPFSEKASTSTSMTSINTQISRDEIIALGIPKMYSSGPSSSLNSKTSMGSLKSSSTSLTGISTVSGSSGPFFDASSMNELLLKSDIKVKLHRYDADEEWVPISVARFSLFSNIQTPTYSKFEINCTNKLRISTLVKNSSCSRLGNSGMRFNSIDEQNGQVINYLLEFRNSAECDALYELVQ